MPPLGPTPLRAKRPRRRSGMVLVLCVIMVALMMVLLLALFAGVGGQRRGALNEAAQIREQMLADSAVALVIGQLKQATAKPGQAWISQPGLLRTYDTSATRKPTECFKLYSTATVAAMTDTTGTLDFMSSDVPADWTTRPSEYIDLNSSLKPPGLFPRTVYPIFDPSAEASVLGLSADAGHTAEMPVAWLYQLQDGTLGPAASATAANPIVARIAFWTDDETSKININTAGAAAGWNAPHLNSTNDETWRKAQPAQGEYSSYPGHPATTSLSVAFPALGSQQIIGLTPRYAWGGSQFGAQSTTPGQVLTPKNDRLYASVDELCFSSATDSNNQRVANPLSASAIDAARFVLTAHSVAPETTMLGEPRVAIWPISDGTATAPGITATDRAIAAAATVGPRSYYFQRNSPMNRLDDFDPSSNTAAATSNLKLFNELLTRGSETLPGCNATFASKYPGAQWPQIALEITDFIHALNAVDPTPGLVPFAPGDANGVGRAFVDPLNFTYDSGSAKTTLRGFGRSPTLSSVTMVFYVCGFRVKTTTPPITTQDIDFDAAPYNDDGAAATAWANNFDSTKANNQWKNVTGELVRCFIVPCTFQPGCGFPEVSDACTIEMSSFTTPKLTSGTSTGTLTFNSGIQSLKMGAARKVLPADRSWGGNEGPLAWLAAADNYAATGTINYPFATTPDASSKPFFVPIAGSTDPTTSAGVAWPVVSTLVFAGTTAGTAPTFTISDTNGAVLQTVTVALPRFGVPAPTINGEGNRADDPTAPNSNWNAIGAPLKNPWWYMTLRHRLGTSQNSRAMMIQAGDIAQSVEAACDLREIATLSNITSSSLFHGHPGYGLAHQTNQQGGTHAQNIRFSDGSSVCFAPGATTDAINFVSGSYAANQAVANASYAERMQSLLVVPDWRQGLASADFRVFLIAPCSVPTGTTGVSLTGPKGAGPLGDWDTGLGVEPDGAFINLPDAGTELSPDTAYNTLTGSKLTSTTQRTLNALVPSPVIFGSLPAGIDPTAPTPAMGWRTLLFCPYPAANTTTTPYDSNVVNNCHPGALNPPDHLILDNFWMPVVEPYPISTCMATAGKVNLNDQIAPFTYLHRSTALRALLDSLRLPLIPKGAASTYKNSTSPIASVWNAVDADATIAQIENKFAAGSVDAYLSESEICTVPIVPQGLIGPPSNIDVNATRTALASMWGGTTTLDGSLTGDNLRELPYAQLYGRLTTRSNSYTVHVRVQVLKKLTGDPVQNVWKEGTDVVLGEWRGSYEIERYLDPAATTLTANSYKFSVVSSHAFAP